MILSLRTLIELVELKTKLASLLPFFIGLLFAKSYFGDFNSENTVIFLIAMLIFDMATTMLNNLMDFIHAKDSKYQSQVNIVGRTHLNPQHVGWAIISMMTTAAILGIWLTFQTDWLILLAGIACFGIGIFYTFGPLPLSRLPLGEIFSGLTMGFGITFIAAYINILPAQLLHFYQLSTNWFVQINLSALIALLLVTVMPIASIANIMLANNLCDYAEDIKNKRHTLPMFLGRQNSLILYQILAYGGYFALLVGALLGVLKPVILVSFLSLPLIIKITQQFINKQDKATTFNCALKTHVIANLSLIIGLSLSLL